MEVRVGVAKVPKFDYRESGDSLEVVERPRGGITAIMADAQGSGVPAKRVSRMVVSRAMAMVADGARDGAVARAVHDFLHASKDGKVLSTLTMVSVDAVSGTLVVSRNGGPAVWVSGPQGDMVLDDDCPPIGVGKMVKPSVTEIPLAGGLLAVAVTDGITSAGKRTPNAEPLDLASVARKVGPEDPETIAGAILTLAVNLDAGKPSGDMTVLALSVVPEASRPRVRRLSLWFPI